MNKEKETKVGDVIDLTFVPSREGRIPVARVPEGKIALLNRGKLNGYWVNAGSTHRVNVDEVYEKKVIVTPFLQLRTAEENELLMAEMNKELTAKFNPHQNEHRRHKKA